MEKKEQSKKGCSFFLYWYIYNFAALYYIAFITFDLSPFKCVLRQSNNLIV